ncbi:MAG: DNRLRE domain-containing protein [Candidatus Sabulitectum sp.]|nr:DNRLRE domain-containing protein [Candidatus Sabulitectum sp.]
MRRLFPLQLIALCFVILAGNAPAIDLPPTADMTTTPSEAATTTAYIEICFRPAHGHPDTRGSMLFDLSPYTGWTAESAILNIDVFYKSGCGLPTTFHTFAATEEWDESWTEAHLAHGTTDWGTFTLNELQWYQLDITDLVNAWLSQSIENCGLVFESINNNQAEHKFYSLNAGVSTVRPYLTLTFPQALRTTTWAGVKTAIQ